MISFLRIFLVVLSLLFICTTTTQAGTFIDNNDGTIFDIQSSLMWQQADDGTERIWQEAVRYCEKLELAGNSDWQLPKIFMLEGLIDPGQSPTINPLFSVKTSYYWSSSESRTSVTSAKYVNFFYGNTYTYSKDNTYYALCVRDASADKATPLVADFKVNKVGEASFVQFKAAISGGSEPFFYEWDFGDGDTSSLTDPTHDFQGEGSYSIMLTVSDNDGSIAVASKEILLPLADTIPEPITAEELDVSESGVQEKTNVVDTQMRADGSTVIATEITAEALASENLEVVEEEVVELSIVEGSPSLLVKESGENDTPAIVVEKVATVAEVTEFIDQEETDLAVFDAASQGEVPKDTEEVSQDISAELDFAANPENEAENDPDILSTEVELSATTQKLVSIIEETNGIASPVYALNNTYSTSAEPSVVLEYQIDTIESAKEVSTVSKVVEAVVEPTKEPVIIGDRTADAEPAVVSSSIGIVPVVKRSVLQIFAARNAPLADSSAFGQQLLAYAFANALTGDADLNKDSKVTAYELKGYLNIAMDSLSEGKQNPLISLEGESFSLCSEKQNTYIFVVGASIYHQGKENWPFAVESAELVRKSIEDSCLKVKTISLSGEHANRQEVLQGLLQIKSLIQPDDSLVFYFAGKTDLGSNGRLLFSLYDTIPEVISLTGVSYSDLLGFINTMSTKQVTLLVESVAPELDPLSATSTFVR